MPPALDIAGRRFHRLTVLERSNKKFSHGSLAWICQCDCGQVVVKPACQLNRGVLISCGCQRSENAKLQSKRRRLAEGQSLFNTVLRGYKHRANAKGLSWQLADEQSRAIMAMNCHYCGSPPTRIKKAINGRAWGKFVFNGIDRIDNLQGYEKSNCVPCCWQCNKTKSNMTVTEFIRWLRAVQSHWNNLEVTVTAEE